MPLFNSAEYNMIRRWIKCGITLEQLALVEDVEPEPTPEPEPDQEIPEEEPEPESNVCLLYTSRCV